MNKTVILNESPDKHSRPIGYFVLPILLSFSLSLLLEFDLGLVSFYLEALVCNTVYLCKFVEENSDHCLLVNQHWSRHWTNVDEFTYRQWGLKLELELETQSQVYRILAISCHEAHREKI